MSERLTKVISRYQPTVDFKHVVWRNLPTFIALAVIVAVCVALRVWVAFNHAI